VLKAIAQASELSFPFVFNAENCAVHSGYPTVSLCFPFFFSDNIMANVTSQQQTTALFLSTTVMRTRRHAELSKKLTNLMGNLCCAREHSVQFFVQLF
jgi:hypothetical protein